VERRAKKTEPDGDGRFRRSRLEVTCRDENKSQPTKNNGLIMHHIRISTRVYKEVPPNVVRQSSYTRTRYIYNDDKQSIRMNASHLSPLPTNACLKVKYKQNESSKEMYNSPLAFLLPFHSTTPRCMHPCRNCSRV
jgi:hypothetical protein